MKISDKGKNLIKSFEKCSLKAYKHKGDKTTIGWGNTFYEDGTPVHMGEEITQSRADQLFDFVLARFEAKVSEMVKKPLSQNQFDALVSFTYNVGWGALASSTLLRKINHNPEDPTIESEFLKWVSKGTQFEIGLRKRRQHEADLYFSK